MKNLDESGIVRIGAEIGPSDILVGKITPKGETQLSPEEKLLRAIFGDKAGDVKDSSMRVPPGVHGTVIDAKVFSRGGVEKDARALAIEAEESRHMRKDLQDEIEVVERSAREKLLGILEGKALKTDLCDKKSGAVLLKKTEAMTRQDVESLPIEALAWADVKAPMDEIEKAEAIVLRCTAKVERLTTICENKIENFDLGDELAPGVVKMVKVYVAVKRKLSVGDKMAGRHGNKGVLSRILPIEDMPYFADGTPVDIVLNPLGVPSRMNVGQVLETHLGWASHGMGMKVRELFGKINSPGLLREKFKNWFSNEEYQSYFENLSDGELLKESSLMLDGVPLATPVFDGASEEEIKSFLEEAGLSATGQATLYDGRTGEPFDQDVTVGIMYIMKLHHLVDDKLHARSIGPYSLVTQQPLGGKAQFGVNGWGRWKCGPWKHTGQPIPSRSF